jgi:methyl-accepting chemotaxis protein
MGTHCKKSCKGAYSVNDSKIQKDVIELKRNVEKYKQSKMSLFIKLVSVAIGVLVAATFFLGITAIWLGVAPTKMIFAILVITLIGSIIVYMIMNHIMHPIASLLVACDRLAMGEINVAVPKLRTRDELGHLAHSLKQMEENRELQNQALQSLANGDIKVKIYPQSNEDTLSLAIIAVINEISRTYYTMKEIRDAILKGKLDFRGNPDDFPGYFGNFIVAINEPLNILVTPLTFVSKYIEKIGKGEIPAKVTKEFTGDFKKIKDNINACVDGLESIEVGNRIIGKIGRNNYSEKMEGEYLGIYAEVAKSINTVLGRMTQVVNCVNHISRGDMQFLDYLKGVGKLDENDVLVPSLIEMMENISMMVEETEQMSIIAIEGNLDNRGDASRFPGDYAKVIEGFNKTLDAVIAPIQEASSVLEELSHGNLNVAMEGDFKGQNGQIKEDMNQTIEFLKQYVGEITYKLEKIGEGNLSQEITKHFLGDFVKIKTTINGITTHLSEVMAKIFESAEQVEAGARQLSDGGQELAQGTTEQASSIEELTASIAAVANETMKNAQNANKANELTDKVRKNAEASNNQMGKMVLAMTEINGSSNSISKIIKVIDDIAFQTNILSLNAAVEAARAGEHGKGFAVVAEEVRSLAARSAQAAKETTGLIEGSIEKVATGTKIADETAESLKVILNDIVQVVGLVGDIALASNDQATAITQINQGIEQVSTVVQTNSATAEESAAATEELFSQAEMLKNMVGAFELKNSIEKS